MTTATTGELARVKPPPDAARPRVPPAIPLAIALAWAALIALHASGRSASLDHDTLLGPDQQLQTSGILVYAAAWITMITAMMLPSAAPLVRLFAGVSRSQPRTGLVIAAFVGGYLAVWTLFGWLALGADSVVHRAVEASPWLDARPQLLAAAVLALAGAFQFSSLKDRCLSTCRHPGAYLVSHYRRGARAALHIGWSHGLFCLGCCWALMAVAFAAGMTDLRWMAAFSALMTYEKVGRHGAAVARAAGFALLGLAVVVASQSTPLL